MTPSQILKHLLHVRLRCLSVLRGSGCSFIIRSLRNVTLSGQVLWNTFLSTPRRLATGLSRGPQSLSNIADSIPGCHTGTREEAAGYGDIILLAVPFTQITSLAPEILKGKIVIDANNYYPERDGH